MAPSGTGARGARPGVQYCSIGSDIARSAAGVGRSRGQDLHPGDQPHGFWAPLQHVAKEAPGAGQITHRKALHGLAAPEGGAEPRGGAHEPEALDRGVGMALLRVRIE